MFGAGEFAPHTRHGRQVLAHELAHVVQQAGGAAPDAVAPRVEEDRDLERAADDAARRVDAASPVSRAQTLPSAAPGALQRLVRPENVSCRGYGLRNPDLSGQEAVEAIQSADAGAVTLALRAEELLTFELLLAQAGEPPDAEFDTILQEELGVTLTNPAHHRLIAQQRDRFRRVRETLESGYLRYICRGSDTISLVGCDPEPCGDEYASSCPGNRIVVLCQAFWDEPAERPATILHEPFHIWFHMARHAPNALRRADASCFESFALRVAGQAATASCVDHTGG